MSISHDELARLCEARDTLCRFCDVDKLAECEHCIVNLLINDAFNEAEDEEEESEDDD